MDKGTHFREIQYNLKRGDTMCVDLVNHHLPVIENKNHRKVGSPVLGFGERIKTGTVARRILLSNDEAKVAFAWGGVDQRGQWIAEDFEEIKPFQFPEMFMN